jgi:hypothetical protein
MRSKTQLWLPVIIVFFLFSCKRQDLGDDATPTAPLGKISGKIVAANNRTPIRTALVFTHDNGRLYITQTDAAGQFLLEAPSGNRRITIQSGDGSLFRTEVTANIVAAQTTAISANAVKLNQVATLAYIPGLYDKIEQILIDSMGYTATSIPASSLNNISSLAPYDAIFINCNESHQLNVTPASDQNLADYVANGGSLYVSDYAVSYLVGKATISTDPCNILRAGGFIADSLLCARRTGNVITLSNLPIVSPSLQAFLNKPTVNNITYDLPGWEEIKSHDSNFWEVMVTNSTSNPLLIRTHQYGNNRTGSITVGTTAASGFTVLCYPDPTNPSKKYSISVRNSEVAAFLAKGGVRGVCNNADGSGRIYYTTFHNEPNGHIGNDMKNILEYVILNL